MRRVARYAFEASADSLEADGLWGRVSDLVESFVASKGEMYEDSGLVRLRYHDGRVAGLQQETLVVDGAEVRILRLEEPTNDGVFVTELRLGRTSDTIALLCELSAGLRGQAMVPVSFDAFCPRVVRDIIELDAPWAAGGTTLRTSAKRYRHEEDGSTIAEAIHDPRRRLPLVVVSEFEQFQLHPRLADDMARDLAGLATVAVITDDAAWGVTKALGREWSCYNGAIRLYWPFGSLSSPSPFRHPLWTAGRVMHGADSTKEAASRFRTQLRRRILGLSTLAMRPHPLFGEVDAMHRIKVLETRRDEAGDEKAYIALVEEENSKLEANNRELRDRVAALEVELANAQTTAEWAAGGQPGDVEPETEAPAATVADALERARRDLSSDVLLGGDVSVGIEGLASNAGPPDKILEYLRGLASLAQARRAGPLGATMVKWLSERGFAASVESETTRKNKSEMQRRTWQAGTGRREFELHLKPSDGTSPERCVRIYFDWDETAEKIVVGWVGRHL